MSRTDKDRPWQIIAQDHTGKYTGAYFWHNDWHHRRYGHCTDSCGWTLPHCRFRTPPHEYCVEVWFGPDRSRERSQLRGYAREYNAGHRPDDEHDYDFANYQHRHMGHWLWC